MDFCGQPIAMTHGLTEAPLCRWLVPIGGSSSHRGAAVGIREELIRGPSHAEARREEFEKRDEESLAPFTNPPTPTQLLSHPHIPHPNSTFFLQPQRSDDG
jgi:hypothetical protein